MQQARNRLPPRVRLGVCTILAALMFPAVGSAQASAVPDSILPFIEEFQRLQVKLEGVQREALSRNDSLVARQLRVAEHVNDAAIALDPAVSDHLARLETVAEELAMARSAQDLERMQTLSAESDDLNARIQAAQERALAAEAELQNAVQEFQDDLLNAMRRIDPTIERDLERIQELAAMLSEIGGGRPRP